MGNGAAQNPVATLAAVERKPHQLRRA